MNAVRSSNVDEFLKLIVCSKYYIKVEALAKFNLLIHGVKDTDLRLGDTLLKPAFVEGKNIAKFDRVMMDFPFSMNITEYEKLVNDSYNRFSYGKSPRRSADMAFIMHGLSSLNQNGKAVFVVTNGTLFRQGVVGTIRQNMISADVVEAVIALPDNIYAETGIQTNLLVLNKNKPSERQGKILFINAEQELFNSVKNRNTPIIVERIVNDIDDIVKIVRYPDWQSTTTGKQEVKKALRSVIWVKYKIKDKELFDKSYSYVEMYY